MVNYLVNSDKLPHKYVNISLFIVCNANSRLGLLKLMHIYVKYQRHFPKIDPLE